MSEEIEHFAASARSFFQQNRIALLSTISPGNDGAPFGSIIPYDISDAGDFIIYVSLIAEHYKNLAKDSRGSILAANYWAYDDPQAFGRATALCRFSLVADSDRAAVQQSYLRRFPDSINYEIAHNFVFLRGAPERIRWIKGFGEMGWIDGAQYRSASPDPLSYEAFEIMQHMNEDHTDALREFARHFSGVAAGDGTIGIVELSSTGFVLMHRAHGTKNEISCPFPSAVNSAQEAREMFIAMLKGIRHR